MATHSAGWASRIVARASLLPEPAEGGSRPAAGTVWTVAAVDDRPPVARRPACPRCRGSGFVYLWSVDARDASVWFCDRCKRQWAEPVPVAAIGGVATGPATDGADAAALVAADEPPIAACERCGGASARSVSLVGAEMAQGDHLLCEPCWAFLVEGLRRRQPWVRAPDPHSLYLTARRAWELMDEAAAQLA